MPEMYSYTSAPQEEETWGDYIDYFQAGAWGVVGNYAAEARRRAGQAGDARTAVRMREWQNFFNDKVDANTGEMTPKGREIAQAAFGSTEFWNSPGAWVALQATNTLPSAAASIAPLAFGSNPVTLGAGAALIGAQSSGSVTNDIQKQVDNQTDEWLQENIPQYADDRLNGVDEVTARNNLIELALGNKPFYAFMVGAATGGIAGPLAATARGLAGRAAGKAAEGGLLRTVGKEAGLGAVGEGVQGATEEALTQGALVAGRFQPSYDIGRIAQAGAGEALVGGVLAGGAGGAANVGRARTAIPSTAPPPPEIQQATIPPSAVGTQPAQPPAPNQPSPPSAGLTPPVTSAIPEVGVTVQANDLQPAPEVAVALQSKIDPAAAARNMVQQYQQQTPEQRLARERVRQYQEALPPVQREFRDRSELSEPQPQPQPQRATEALPTPAVRVPPAPLIPPATQAPPPRGIAPLLPVRQEPQPPTGGPIGGPISRQRGPQILPDIRTFEQRPPKERRAFQLASQKVDPQQYGALESGPRDPNDPASVQDWLTRRIEAEEFRNWQATRREAEPVAEPVIETKAHLTKAEIAKAAEDAQVAKFLLKKYGSLENARADREAVRDRVVGIIKDAREANVDLNKKLYDTDTDERFWLKDVYNLYKKFVSKKQPDDEDILKFLSNELLAVTGNFSELRASRKIEGASAGTRQVTGKEQIVAGAATEEEARRKEQRQEEGEIIEEEGVPIAAPKTVSEPEGAGTRVAPKATLLEGRIPSEKRLREEISSILKQRKEEGAEGGLSRKEISALIQLAFNRIKTRRPRKYKPFSRKEQIEEGVSITGERFVEIAKEIEREAEAEAKAEAKAKAKAEKPVKLRTLIARAKKERAALKEETAARQKAVMEREEAREKEKQELHKIKGLGANISFDWLTREDVGSVLTSHSGVEYRITDVLADGKVKIENQDTGKKSTWSKQQLMAAQLAGDTLLDKPNTFAFPTEKPIIPEEPLEKPQLPPVPKAYVRFFHKGTNPAAGGERWATTDWESAALAQRFGKIYYVDVHKLAYANKLWNLAKRNGAVNIPEKWAARFQLAVTPKKPPKAAQIKRKVKEVYTRRYMGGMPIEEAMALLGPRVKMQTSKIIKRPRGYAPEVEAGTPTNAERRGEGAYYAGMKFEDNPFSVDSALWKRWNEGFTRAEIEDRMTTPRPFVRPTRQKEIAPKIEAYKQKEMEHRRGVARSQIDREATDAQRAAGNARGGLFNWRSLELMLQYAKGMKRFDTELIADYGHIKGTKGADGKPIDFYLGPNLRADTVYVIDQINPETGKFDEHKAMIGFNNEFDAASTYAYTVGRDRLGDVTPMTIPEFKEWLEKPKKEPVGEVEVPSPEELAPPTTPVETIPANLMDRLNEVAVTRHTYGQLRNWVGEWLNDVNFNSLPEGAREKLPQLISRIEDSIADTPVYIVPQEFIPGRAGFYDPANNVVVVRSSTPAEGNLGRRMTLHEAGHAALIKATAANPELRNVITQAAMEFRSALSKAGITRDFYAFKNVDEFMTEFISNPSMWAQLAKTKASDELKTASRPSRGPIRSLLDVIRKAIARFFGLSGGKDDDTLLDIMITTTSNIHNTLSGEAPGPMTAEELLSRASAPTNNVWTGKSGDQLFFGGVQDYAKQAIDHFRPSNLPQTKVFGLKFRGMDQIAQLAKDFGTTFSTATRLVVNAFERMQVHARQLLSTFDPHMEKWVALQRKYRGAQWDEFGEYLLDETDAGVYGDRPLSDQPHLKEGELRSAYAIGRHPKLAERWARLPADLKELRNEALAHTKEQQKQMALGIIRNQILKIMGVRDEGLAIRLYEKKELTDEEKAVMTPELEYAIKNARALTAPKGPYYPQMRFGKYVVTGRYKYVEPSNGKRVADQENTFEFTDRDDAMEFAKTQSPYSSIRSAYVDPSTNLTYFIDEEENEVSAKELLRAEKRYRVTVQNKLVEFFETEKEAQNRAAELKGEEDFTLDAVGPRAFDPDEAGGREFLAHDMHALLNTLEKQPGFMDKPPEQRRALQQTLTEMGMRFYGPTRVQARRRPRRHVLGASTDFHKVMAQYFQSVAGYRAKLEVQPELDKALMEMKASIYDQEAGGQKSWAAKQAIYNEVANRLVSRDKVGPPTNWDIWANRIMGLTFVNYLASPAYAVNNALQVAMIGMPQLAAKYGAGRAGRALIDAYKTAGIRKIVKAGLKATYRAAVAGEKTNFLDEILTRIPDEGARKMIKYLQENGTISPTAGMEYDRIIGGSRIDTVVDYLQNMARSTPAAVETMNRVVLGLAVYNLEMRKSGNHQLAMETAQEIVNLTQGNYSRTNMPTFFHNPLLSLSFQFKNYGQTIYGLIGHNIGKMIRNKTTNPQEYAEARNALIMLAGTHLLMAGALGLPTEPIRWLLMGANMFGLGLSWEEVENMERELAASIFGNYGGELFSRGLPRALGIDVSSRLGAQNLLTYGTPRDNDEYSISAYLGDLAGGAAFSTGLEMQGGISDMLQGDFLKGMQKIAPFKLMSDSITAFTLATEGKITEAGYQRMPPVPIMEAFMKAFGYTPARQAEVSERAQYFYAAQRGVTRERNRILHDWIRATPGEKPKVIQRMREFNRGRPIGEQLSIEQLNDYKKRRAGEEVFEGFKINRRNRELIQSLDLYNTQ